MSEPRALQAAHAFLQAPGTPGAPGRVLLLGLLHPQARYRALGRESQGAEAIRMLRAPAQPPNS